MNPPAGRRAAVCGSPIAHSLSPVLHRAAYAALGLHDWTYDLLEVDEERLPAVVGALDASWAGLSLTMPLKQAVIGLLDEVSPFARAVDAVNTVVVEAVPDAGDGGVRLRGENTDVDGIVAALAGHGVPAVERGVVVGGGATARSALVALLRAGCRRPVAVVRGAHRAAELQAVAARLGGAVEVLDWSQLARARAADSWSRPCRSGRPRRWPQSSRARRRTPPAGPGRCSSTSSTPRGRRRWRPPGRGRWSAGSRCCCSRPPSRCG